MGIHNEPGHARVSMPPLSQLTEQLLNMITNTSDKERGFLPFKNDGSDEVIVLVNNLGGVSELELSGIAGSVVSSLSKRLKIQRVLAGTFMVCGVTRPMSLIFS